MAETDRYRTVGATASAEIEVKRSRFLCALRPALTEEEARQAIDEARRAHWDARHHCSAFVLGPRGDLRRSNDDGEPSGTAGMPILDALTGAELTNVVAVVTRWFGGTLLGTGGLVRAYGDAVRAALDLAVVEEYARMTLVSVGVDMADVGRVENALRTAGHLVEGVDYGSRAMIRLAVNASSRERLDSLVAELTSGHGVVVAAGEKWVRTRC